MKARQFKAKQQVNDKNVALRQEQKMNEFLDKIHREHFEIEKWQQNMKKTQMRENIQESLKMRELADKQLAENLLKKEAQINRLFKPQVRSPLNIHENTVEKVGSSNLVDMHRTPGK